MTISKETQEKQQQMAKNLTKLFTGINGTGHKDLPKPSPEAPPLKKQGYYTGSTAK
jgi:hypothetical protein